MLVIDSKYIPKTLQDRATYIKEISTKYHNLRVTLPNWVNDYMVYVGNGYTIRINGESCAHYQKTKNAKSGILRNLDLVVREIQEQLKNNPDLINGL